MKVTDFVNKDSMAVFNRYRNGVFFYRIHSNETVSEHGKHNVYEFPIPREDIEGSTLNLREKSLMLMRYIRKAIADNTLIKIENSVSLVDYGDLV